ncbi:dehydrogenase/reductase [Coniochaeta ligniaria NRRL 30616]|uniref:Dehydrogenase/reductase n=1 Tax=Coniochaeta ligniaria NRRL 30616 TaxID=1408157 RepID=A0A1J7IHT6_9PEZI|nr:dehydrogenase/reductase [Coniochaeta ligniaria NRRL 30616]
MATKRTGSVLFTGGTSGLGFCAARDIARAHPDYVVVLASRTDGDGAAQRINKMLNQDNTVFLPLDLSDTNNVRTFAENWPSQRFPPIKAILLNAGLQFPGELKKSAQGIEKTFAVAHVGHALLFHLMCPYLAKNARIVVTSSGTHDPAQKSGLPDAVYNTAEELAFPPASTVNNQGRQRYATAKLVNVLWTYAVHRRLSQRVPDRGITINAFDPGLVPGTGLGREAGWVVRFLLNHVLPHMLPVLRALYSENVHTKEESGAALARLAVGVDVEGVSGKYFEGLKERESSKDSYDESKQDDLWAWTVKYLTEGREDEKVRFEEFK